METAMAEQSEPLADPRPGSPAAARAAARARLFQGFLDLRPRCEVCGLDYAFADAGDGPAVFVILHRGLHRGRLRADRRVQVRAAAVAARGAVAAADPGDHACCRCAR